MEPITTALMVGSALAPVAGSLIDKLFNDESSGVPQSVRDLQALGYPPAVARNIALKQYQEGQQQVALQEQEMKLGPALASLVKPDQAMVQKQEQAIADVSRVARGGLRPEDLAALNRLRRDTAQASQARQEQLLQSMAARGMAGSGAELAARLSSSQADQAQAAAESDRLAELSSQRALQALGNLGALTESARRQGFQEQFQTAQEADAISKFNVENAISRQMRNIARQQDVQRANTGRSWEVSDKNVGQFNAQQLRDAEADLQDWRNTRDYLQGLADAETRSMPQRKPSTTFKDVGTALGQTATAYNAYDAADKQTKAQLEALKNQAKYYDTLVGQKK